MKIALNVVKDSKLVQMKLITIKIKISACFCSYANIGCLSQRQFAEEEILEKVFT